MNNNYEIEQPPSEPDIEQPSNSGTVEPNPPEEQSEKSQSNSCTTREKIGSAVKFGGGVMLSVIGSATNNNSLRYAAASSLLASVAIEAPLQEQQQTKINASAKIARMASGGLLMASAITGNQTLAYPSMVLQAGATLGEIYEKAPRIIEKVRQYIPKKQQEQNLEASQTTHAEAEIQRRKSTSDIVMGGR